MKLTATTVKAAAPGKHHDGRGLYLVVKPSGARSWVVRLTVDGRQRDMGLGGYPAVSLKRARQIAAAERDKARAGGDPVAERRSKAATFGEAAEAVHAQKLPNFTSAKAAAEWMARLRRHALDTLGEMPLDRIGRDDVLAVLDPIWTTKPHTARKVRDAMAQVFRFGIARGWIDRNPAGEMIDGALIAQPASRNHDAAPWSEVPEVMARLADHDGGDVVRLCLAFTILTAARGAEARGARWAEIDTAAEVWTIPAERMKSRRPHVVPLSAQALAVLEEARSHAWAGSPFVFPSPLSATGEVSNSATLRTLRRHGCTGTVHGFRSAFKTWSLEATATPWAVSEAALAHRVGDDVASRYVRGDLLDARRALMQQWADYVTMPTTAEVPDSVEALTG